MDRNYLITKSNTLINTRYDLKLEEQKIILALASMVQPDDEDFKPYVMSVREFAELTGVESAGNKYTRLRKLTKELMTKVFEIETDKEYIQVAWLSSCRYIKDSGMIELKFSDELKPYMLQLKNKFTSYYLSNVLQMKSKYSIRLYEILKSEQYKSRTALTLDELRFILKCENYAKWQNMKQRVIEPSIIEINKLTDILIDYTPIKKGRSIIALEFTIEKNGIAAEIDWQTEKDLDGSEYLQSRII